MKRRTFNFALAAIVPAMMLKLKPAEIDLHKLLKSFCNDDNYPQRYDLETPFVYLSKAYASDGRIIASINSVDEETDREIRRIPNPLKVYDAFWNDASSWHPVEPYSADKLDVNLQIPFCSLCENRVISLTDEQWEEAFYAPFDYEKYPGLDPDDGTYRDPSCPRCKGNDDIYDNHAKLFGEKIVNREFWKKMAAVPGCEWNLGNNSLTEPILFRSSIGIDGMVMPMNGQKAKEWHGIR